MIPLYKLYKLYKPYKLSSYGKVIIFSAPSGAGKSTIVNYLLEKGLGLEFSISATCRAPRGKEIHGKEYYFFTADEFRKRIENKEFLEWEEVYPGCYYGTLLSEIDRIWAKGHTVLFDVDVVGRPKYQKKFRRQCVIDLYSAPICRSTTPTLDRPGDRCS